MTTPTLIHKVDRAAGQRGRLFTVPLYASVAAPAPGPALPAQPEEQDFTVCLQPVALPYQWIAGGRKTGMQQTVVAVINYGAGGARFTKAVTLTHTVERRFTVHARYIDVAFYVSGGTTAGDVIEVSAAIVKGSFAGPDKYSWAMAQAPIDGAQSGMLSTGPGVLGWLHVIMQGVPTAGGPLWYVVGCDVANTGQIVSGATPVIAGFLSDPLGAVGATDVLSDDQAPGAVGWSNGLFIGVSTTTGIYTSPGAGAVGGQVHADLKAGQ